MGDRLAEIQKALDRFERAEARELARRELTENPSAEAAYLAAQAAMSHGQRVEYLELALELDASYQPAIDELKDIAPDSLPKPKREPVPELEAPSAPERQRRPASLVKRWIAIVIDGVIIAIPTIMLVGVSGISATMEAALLAGDATQMSAAFSAFQSEVLKLNLLTSAIYNMTLMTMFNGQTLGKMILGLRVVKKNGKRISILDALIRNVFGYTISGFFLLGYFWALVDRERQAWHDKLVGTVVVDERGRK